MSQHHTECLQVYWLLWGLQLSSYNHGKVQLLIWCWNLQPLCVSSAEEYPLQRAWSRKEEIIFKKNHWNSDTGGKKNWVMLGVSCRFWIQKRDAHYRQPCRYSSAIDQFRVKPVFQMTSSKDQASKWLEITPTTQKSSQVEMNYQHHCVLLFSFLPGYSLVYSCNTTSMTRNLQKCETVQNKIIFNSK